MPQSAYYQRTAQPDRGHGTVFSTPADKANEQRVATTLGNAWRCTLHPWGRFSPVDWYALRQEHLVAVAELKTRSHASDRYPTVFLSIRKWGSLLQYQVNLGVPAMFVIQLTDGLFWISLSDIDARKHRMGGCMQLVKSYTDIEPVIEIPISELRRVKQ